MSAPLKPCPFCPDGGAPYHEGDAYEPVTCADCGARGPKDSDNEFDMPSEECLAAWNRRAPVFTFKPVDWYNSVVRQRNIKLELPPPQPNDAHGGIH
jgi:hypothetical protein